MFNTSTKPNQRGLTIDAHSRAFHLFVDYSVLLNLTRPPQTGRRWHSWRDFGRHHRRRPLQYWGMV